MNRLLIVGLLASAPMACANCKETPVAEPKLPLPRDGNIAIQEELCAARARATKDAYDLFIARHPRHRLAETARKERAELEAGRAPVRGADCN